MGDPLLGLDPADFGTTGLTLGMLLGVAMKQPEWVLPRGRIYAKGDETVASWRLRAVQQLLKDHGVDLDAHLTREGTPAPMPSPEPDDLHKLDEMHDELDTWTARVVYTMKTADVYVLDIAHFHTEPRLADLHDVLDDALMERDLALGRRSLITMTPYQGFPLALEPTEIASIRVDLIGPDGQQILPVASGSLEHTGPVERDENGDLK